MHQGVTDIVPRPKKTSEPGYVLRDKRGFVDPAEFGHGGLVFPVVDNGRQPGEA